MQNRRLAIFALSLAIFQTAPPSNQLVGLQMLRYHSLTQEERAVIELKGTEAPNSGALCTCQEPGIYVCRRCDHALFLSGHKFDSHCGWPSFDQELTSAVKRVPDRDGRRTEILCKRCGAHLGHVFTGEHLTDANTRHCVNSLSIALNPLRARNGLQRAIVAGGCFWGVEHHLKKLKGVFGATSGYIGGSVVNPSYQEVCSGNSGHAEAVEVLFDERQTSYEEILKAFFEIHDPQQYHRQGPDIGSQYRSAIFYLSREQQVAGIHLIAQLEERGFRVVTEIAPAMIFYPAEDYHQNYIQRTGRTCHSPVKRFD